MNELYIDHAGGAVRWFDVRPECGSTIVGLPGLILPVEGKYESVADHPGMADRRIISLDYPGGGRSDHPKTFEYSMASLAGIIADVLDHLGTGPVDVIGHSMGGNVGLALAKSRPDLVSRLLVAEANLHAGGGGFSSIIAEQDRATFLSKGFPALLDRIAADPGLASLAEAAARSDPARLWSNATELVNLDPQVAEDFRTLPIPRTFVYGGRNVGKITPDTPDPEPLRAAGVDIAIVPDAGHSMMHDNPQAFADIVARAFAR